MTERHTYDKKEEREINNKWVNVCQTVLFLLKSPSFPSGVCCYETICSINKQLFKWQIIKFKHLVSVGCSQLFDLCLARKKKAAYTSKYPRASASTGLEKPLYCRAAYIITCMHCLKRKYRKYEQLMVIRTTYLTFSRYMSSLKGSGQFRVTTEGTISKCTIRPKVCGQLLTVLRPYRHYFLSQKLFQYLP